jgi:hypothetical protein
MFPNPASDLISFRMDSPYNYSVFIDIKNVFGETVVSLELNPGQTILDYKVDNLSRGVYYVNFTGTAFNTKTYKLILE